MIHQNKHQNNNSLKNCLNNKHLYFLFSSDYLKHGIKTSLLTFCLNSCDEFKCYFLLFFLRFDINDFYFSFLSSQKICYLKFVLRFLCFSTKNVFLKCVIRGVLRKTQKIFFFHFVLKKI